MIGEQPRIAFLTSSNAAGGAELMAHRLAQWMAERGWPVYLFAGSTHPLWEATSGDRLTVIDAASVRNFVRRIEDEHIRCMFVNSSRDLRLAVRGAWLRRPACPLVMLQHMQPGRRKRDPLHALLFSKLRYWVSPLQGLADLTHRAAGIPYEKIRVIPHGIELRRFLQPAIDRATARTVFGLPSDAAVIGNVGRLDYGKGQVHLLEALAILRRRGRNVVALIVGDETAGESQNTASHLRARVDALGISDATFFHAARPDVETAFRAMDIFALTSLSETYGLVTIEAMASGLPVIGTRSAGTPELLDDGRTGLLVPPADSAALASAIEGLLENSILARTLSDSARHEAMLRFSHSAQCEALEVLISDALKS